MTTDPKRPPEAITNAMTVDVEDYFQVSAFERNISREDWDKLPCRVESNTNRILELFAENDVHATFFMLGWIALRYPDLVRRISEEGHEVASHGMAHIRIVNQSPEEFRKDASEAKALLEDISGRPVQGYRAASFSIGESNLWALDILGELGYRYSSSIYPIRHDLYGMPDAPRFPFLPGNNGLLEVPVTTLRLLEHNFPSGGGGYFRLFPYSLSSWIIRRVNQQDRQPAIFYFHPWEVDPAQPRQNNINLKTRFRHYVNLGKTESRIRRLLTDFKWGRMDRIFLDGGKAAAAGAEDAK